MVCMRYLGYRGMSSILTSSPNILFNNNKSTKEVKTNERFSELV